MKRDSRPSRLRALAPRILLVAALIAQFGLLTHLVTRPVVMFCFLTPFGVIICADQLPGAEPAPAVVAPSKVAWWPKPLPTPYPYPAPDCGGDTNCPPIGK